MCVAPLQGPYSEAHPTRPEGKAPVFSSWWICRDKRAWEILTESLV